MIPLLRPSLQSALIIRTIFAFQTFAVVFALAGRNLPVLAGEAYTHYATNQDEHLAAAYAVVILGTQPRRGRRVSPAAGHPRGGAPEMNARALDRTLIYGAP